MIMINITTTTNNNNNNDFLRISSSVNTHSLFKGFLSLLVPKQYNSWKLHFHQSRLSDTRRTILANNWKLAMVTNNWKLAMVTNNWKLAIVTNNWKLAMVTLQITENLIYITVIN